MARGTVSVRASSRVRASWSSSTTAGVTGRGPMSSRWRYRRARARFERASTTSVGLQAARPESGRHHHHLHHPRCSFEAG